MGRRSEAAHTSNDGLLLVRVRMSGLCRLVPSPAMLVGRLSVLSSLFVSAVLMMVGGLAVVMSRAFMGGSRR